MAEVPLPMNELENLVADIALELMESWASEGRIPDGEEAKYGQLAVDDAVFVINLFMEKFNDVMNKAQIQSLIQ